MTKWWLLIFCGMTFYGCASVEQAGRAYFRDAGNVKGVEPADALLERMKSEKQLRHLTYGQVKSTKLIQCTLLRNQIYVAAMKSSSLKEVNEAVKIMETAYQDNDEAFLDACDQILATDLGKSFVAIQQQYLIDHKETIR